uniref:Uncharacterized protein n=1 Tax=Panagrolaimus davidi TaxID=227884 RepID=A0A914QJZ6_9BILA
MAQLQSNQSPYSGIDVTSKISNDNSCINTDDIIGTSVTLSTVSMDQIESIVQKYRNPGKRLPKSKAPLNLKRPFSGAQSPLTKSAISISAETLTALNFSLPLSPSSRYHSFSNANLPSINTGQEITPRTSEIYQHLVPALAESYIQTGHKLSPTRTSFEYSTAISRCSTLPSTHHQSISNVHLSSTKIGREIIPRNNETSLITARFNSSIRTGREVSPIPKSSGYQTALSAASPFSPSTQSLFVLI